MTQFRLYELRHLVLTSLTDFVWVTFMDLVVMLEHRDERVEYRVLAVTVQNLCEEGRLVRKRNAVRSRQKYLYKLPDRRQS